MGWLSIHKWVFFDVFMAPAITDKIALRWLVGYLDQGGTPSASRDSPRLCLLYPSQDCCAKENPQVGIAYTRQWV